ncbi:hypothetical protein DENSPDRAFT_875142 [Dentipellis sp. KUC8613]|nr:hypothetical protein DENSPDRAFT_875142 [Dentipellis sp. KUC8613]
MSAIATQHPPAKRVGGRRMSLPSGFKHRVEGPTDSEAADAPSPGTPADYPRPAAPAGQVEEESDHDDNDEQEEEKPPKRERRHSARDGAFRYEKTRRTADDNRPRKAPRGHVNMGHGGARMFQPEQKTFI